MLDEKDDEKDNDAADDDDDDDDNEDLNPHNTNLDHVASLQGPHVH